VSGLRTSRRAVLAGGAGCAAAAVALGRDATLTQEFAAATAASRATVVLQDRRLPVPADISARLQGNGAQLLELEADPVRMWRGALAPLLASRDTRLLGVTQWPQFLLVSGLAAESGRRVRYRRYDAASDSFVWLIA
jgi:hypothetical protein